MSINTKPPVIKGHTYCKNERVLALGMVNGCCIFCGTSVDDESKLGEFILHTHTGWKMHYFCLTLSSGLQQTVDEESSNTKNHPDHVFGFTIKEIFLEVKRARRLKCSYCKKPGASIGCIVSKCKKMMHVPCGADHGALSRFYHDFSTLCNQHRPHHHVYDKIPYYQRNSKNGVLSELVNSNSESGSLESVNSNSKSLVVKQKVDESAECSITCSACLEDLHPPFDQAQIIVSPCCMNLYTHKICLQRHANSCGLHFFRCPGCNNTQQFQQHMLEMGIFIPDRDAAWETESHAFSDLLQRYNKCDAIFCLCPHGRDHISSGSDSDWKVVLCDMCGSSGTHIACHPDVTHEKSYFVCAQCLSTFGEDGAFDLAKQMGIIVEKKRRRSPSNNQAKPRRRPLQRKLAIEASTTAAPQKSKPVAPRKTVRRRPTTTVPQPRKRPALTPVKAGPAPKKPVSVSESGATDRKQPSCNNTTQRKPAAPRKTVSIDLGNPESSQKPNASRKTSVVKSSHHLKQPPVTPTLKPPPQQKQQTVSFQQVSMVEGRASARSKPTAPRKTLAHRMLPPPTAPKPSPRPTPIKCPPPTPPTIHDHNTRASSRNRNSPHATRSSAFNLYPVVDLTLRRRRTHVGS